MEFRRVKNTRWENVRATMKNFVYNYTKEHEDIYKTGDFAYNDGETDENGMAIKFFEDNTFGIVSLSAILYYLSEQFACEENRKYYDNCEVCREFENNVIVNPDDGMTPIDLEFVLHLYGDAFWDLAGCIDDDDIDLTKEFYKSLLVGNVKIDGQNVPVYLGTLYAQDYPLTGIQVRIMQRTLASIMKKQYTSTTYFHQLVNAMRLLPVENTYSTYIGYISEHTGSLSDRKFGMQNSRSVLEKFVMSTLAILNPEPSHAEYVDKKTLTKIMNDPTTYRRNMRIFLNELSIAGVNFMEITTRNEYKTILAIDKYKNDERNVFKLAGHRSDAVIENLARDVLVRLNEFIEASVKEYENKSDISDMCMVTMPAKYLSHYGVGIAANIRGNGTATIYSQLRKYMRASEMNRSDYVYDIHRVTEAMNACMEIVVSVDAMEGLLLSSFRQTGEDSYLIDKLSLPSFMVLMKLYARYASYTYRQEFDAASGAYQMMPLHEGLVSILFEAFRIYFRHTKNPFRYLSYVIDPVELIGHVVRRMTVVLDSNRYESSRYPISNIFDITYIQGVLQYEEIARHNDAMIANPDLLVQFIVSGCCNQVMPMYLRDFKVAKNPEASYASDLLEFRDARDIPRCCCSDNPNAFRNDQLELNVDAVDIIKQEVIDTAADWPAFKKSLFHITTLVPTNNAILVTERGTAPRTNTVEPAALMFMNYLALYKKED